MRGRRDGLSAGRAEREGLIRNRYSGRTFIEGSDSRVSKAAAKYTPLREVLEGKRVLLVEDSIVRSTTMRVLISRMREVGRAREIHVRVACPPITSPCFYGIDMSTISELFAPRFMHGDRPLEEVYAEMARELGADSLRYLPIESIARAVDRPADELVPGVHHGPLSDAARPETVSDRAGQCAGGDERRQPAADRRGRTKRRRHGFKIAAIPRTSVVGSGIRGRRSQKLSAPVPPLRLFAKPRSRPRRRRHCRCHRPPNCSSGPKSIATPRDPVRRRRRRNCNRRASGNGNQRLAADDRIGRANWRSRVTAAQSPSTWAECHRRGVEHESGRACLTTLSVKST